MWALFAVLATTALVGGLIAAVCMALAGDYAAAGAAVLYAAVFAAALRMRNTYISRRAASNPTAYGVFLRPPDGTSPAIMQRWLDTVVVRAAFKFRHSVVLAAISTIFPVMLLACRTTTAALGISTYILLAFAIVCDALFFFTFAAINPRSRSVLEQYGALAIVGQSAPLAFGLCALISTTLWPTAIYYTHRSEFFVLAGCVAVTLVKYVCVAVPALVFLIYTNLHGKVGMTPVTFQRTVSEYSESDSGISADSPPAVQIVVGALPDTDPPYYCPPEGVSERTINRICLLADTCSCACAAAVIVGLFHGLMY